ncbi:MAG: hypothetical protein LBB68_08920 [Treponema sp.]|jgi:hypothetical protein|nr:hypothetical protein [Treponema sp.]
MSTDWLPASRTEQLATARNWISIINAPVDPPDWGIPPAKITAFITIVDTAEAALLRVQSDSERTPVATAQCNTAFKALTGNMRYLKNRFFLVPPLTESDLIALGLKSRDSSSPTPTPDAQPEADLTFPGIHLVELRNIRPMAGGTAPNPRSNYGVRIYYGLTGEPTEAHRFRVTGTPKTGKDLPYSLFTHRKRERFDFDGESGNRVYFCLQYERPKGGEKGKGPFGPILSAVIP